MLEVKKVRNWARDSLHFQNEHLQKGGEVLLLNLILKDPIKSTETEACCCLSEKAWHSVEPQFYEPLYNKLLSITNKFLYLSDSKIL